MVSGGMAGDISEAAAISEGSLSGAMASPALSASVPGWQAANANVTASPKTLE